MAEIRVDLGERSYDIVIGRDILGGLGDAMAATGCGRRAVIISNPTVFSLYGDAVAKSLDRAHIPCSRLLVPDGEIYKDYFWAFHLLTSLLEQNCDRKTCLVALGGGVIGDITGFAASLFMRGVAFVQVPTTLLAQVDSAVGGKTAVNHPLGKNMIGTFCQPSLVWADTATLDTLPRREFTAGMAEVIKYGIIHDEAFFGYLEQNRRRILDMDHDCLAFVAARSCAIKADVVSRDERESGLRATLNFGHTVGHAIETETGYTRFLHGEAVAMGMWYETKIAEARELIGGHDVARVRDLLTGCGLSPEMPDDLAPGQMIAHMRRDKKTTQGMLTFILPEGIGRVRIVRGIDEGEIGRVFRR